MGRIPTTRIPIPITGTNRIHKTLLAFTNLPSTPSLSQPHPASPTRSDLENAYGDSAEDPAPEPASDQLMSLKEILAAPTVTPMERALARPYSGDFGQAVKVFDQDGGWDEKVVRKGGLSKLRISHDAAKFLGGEDEGEEDEEDDNETWTKVEEGVRKEGYRGKAAALLASLEEVVGQQEAEKGKRKGKGLARRFRKKLSRKEISWPVAEEGLGWMGAVMAGTKEIEKMAVQARKEGREVRVEQIALRVQELVHSLRE